MLKHEQLKVLQGHRPIPHGGWKLAAGIIACVTWILGISLGLAPYLRGQLVDAGSALPLIAIAIPFALSMSYYLEHTQFHRRPIADAWPFGWIRTYWHMNRTAYAVRFYWAEREGTKHLAYMIDAMPQMFGINITRINADTLRAPFVISLPLNGKPATFDTTNNEMAKRLEGWSVHLRAILDTGVPDTSGVMVEIRYRNHQWGVEECVVTDIANALRCLEEIATDASHLRSSGIWTGIIVPLEIALDVATREREELERRMTALFDTLREAVGNPPFDPKRPLADRLEEEGRRLIAQRDAARGEMDRHRNELLPTAVKDRDTARQERDAAIHFVNDLDIALQEAHRLRTTLGGLRLRMRILEWLKAHDPRWTEEGPQSLAPILATVRAELAEKENRDRRRRGKSAGRTSVAEHEGR